MIPQGASSYGTSDNVRPLLCSPGTRQLKHHMMTMTLATEIPTCLFDSKVLMSSGGLLAT